MKYFIEFKERGKNFWFRIMHDNGNIISTSEMYTRRASRTRIANNLARATGMPVMAD